MFTIIEIVALVWYLASAAGWVFIFPHIGEKGWKAIIPFYGQYTKFKAAGKSKTFIAHAILMAILLFLVVLTYGMYLIFLVDADNQALAKNMMFCFVLSYVIGFIINALLHYKANKNIVERLHGSADDAANMAFLPCVYVLLFAINTCTGYNKRHNASGKTTNKNTAASRFRRLN